MPKKYNRVLTIAGSDSGGGAGIQADLKTFTVLGCFGMSAITALTAQNTLGVQSIHALPADIVAAQIQSVLSDIGVDAIKIGMLERAELITVVFDQIKNVTAPIILDPVMFAKGGTPLLAKDAIDALKKYLLPIATLITPNIPEAEYLSGRQIKTIDDMKAAAIDISQYRVKNVLVKGGHLDGKQCIDILYLASEKLFIEYPSKKIQTQNTHGTGCTLSAAITAYCAKGVTLQRSVDNAKKFMSRAIRSGAKYQCGAGHGPVNHCF